MVSAVTIAANENGVTRWFGRVDDGTYHSGEMLRGVIGHHVPFFTSSTAKNVVKESLAHARHWHPVLGDGKWVSTPLATRGTILHALLFRTEDLHLVVCDVKNFQTKAAQEQRDAALAAGKIPVKKSDMAEYEEAAEWLRDYLRVYHDLDIDAGESEVAAAWVDPGTGLQCQLKLDHVIRSKRIVWDLKCTGLANPGQYDEQNKIDDFIVKQLHHVQAGAYLEGLAQVFGESHEEWNWQWILFDWDDVPMVVVAELTPEMREIGMLRWRWAARKWAHAVAANDWPGYTRAGEVLRPVPPRWEIERAMAQAEI